MSRELVGGRFRIGRVVGRGTVGEVHRAEDPRAPQGAPERTPAVKRMLRSRAGARIDTGGGAERGVAVAGAGGGTTAGAGDAEHGRGVRRAHDDPHPGPTGRGDAVPGVVRRRAGRRAGSLPLPGRAASGGILRGPSVTARKPAAVLGAHVHLPAAPSPVPASASSASAGVSA